MNCIEHWGGTGSSDALPIDGSLNQISPDDTQLEMMRDAITKGWALMSERFASKRIEAISSRREAGRTGQAKNDVRD